MANGQGKQIIIMNIIRVEYNDLMKYIMTMFSIFLEQHSVVI